MTDDRKGIDPALANLLKKAPSEELDYGFVMDCLKEYANPRIKLHHLLKIEALIKVKKGLYVFSQTFRRKPYCSEVLANMIYGPSYVSLEWACQYWRLIPEKVTIVTNVTSKRSKAFKTPVGTFSYEHLPLAGFAVGMTRVQFSGNQLALIATREKALIDLLILRRGSIRSLKQMQEILFEDLRIEESDLVNLDFKQIEEIGQAYPHSAIHHLLLLRKVK